MAQIDRPAERLGALARRLVRGVTERTKRELAAAGYPDVRPIHNLVLGQLGGGGARITAMAARLGMTKQAVTLMVDHLEGRGYVTRVADPDDGRAKLVELTAKGREAAATSWRVAEAIEREWAARLGPAQLGALKSTLGDLADSLAGRDATPGPATSTG
jgi:DNA-binding MarR family transcriptional regulator